MHRSAKTAAPTPAMSLEQAASKAFPAVARILANWEVNGEGCATLMGIPTSTWYAYARNPEKVKPGRDMAERMSYILNIHAALRTVFGLPESVYGWVRKPNNHPFFDGRSALDVMLNGRVMDLADVARRLDAIRGSD